MAFGPQIFDGLLETTQKNESAIQKQLEEEIDTYLKNVLQTLQRTRHYNVSRLRDRLKKLSYEFSTCNVTPAIEHAVGEIFKKAGWKNVRFVVGGRPGEENRKERVVLEM